MKCTHVTLTYFKKSGKYYSEGELDLEYKPILSNENDGRPWMFHEVIQEVAERLNRNECPGLVDGTEFDVLVTVFTEFGPLRWLFVRRSR